jgi:hypothetical protein
MKAKDANLMNLYIINEVLSDYTSGMVVIAAASKERCRELFIEQFSEYHAEEFDKYAKFTVIEGVPHAEGVVDYVYGGG